MTMQIDLAQQISEVAVSKETKNTLKKFLKANKITLTRFVDAYNLKYSNINYSAFHYKVKKAGDFTPNECENINNLISETLSTVKA